MGAGLSGYNHWMHPDEYPEPNSKPKFDPLYGFADGREEKVMPVSEAEMESMKIPYKYRDFCVDKYVKFKVCKADNFPFLYRCHHQLHEYHDCQYQEYIDQMKDYERERRLMARAKRIAAKAEGA